MKSLKFISIFIIIFSFFSCNKDLKKDIIGIYKGDKIAPEFSDSDYRYLILNNDGTFDLKYFDVKKTGANGSWKILNKKKDTLNIQFNFSNRIITGKLIGNYFLFNKPNVFDQRFPSWLYIKTNMKNIEIK